MADLLADPRLKFQNPNSKFQRNSKSQTPIIALSFRNSRAQRAAPHSEFGAWNLFGIWSLEFGVCCSSLPPISKVRINPVLISTCIPQFRNYPPHAFILHLNDALVRFEGAHRGNQIRHLRGGGCVCSL